MSTPQMNCVNENNQSNMKEQKARLTSITSDNLFCRIYK